MNGRPRSAGVRAWLQIAGSDDATAVPVIVRVAEGPELIIDTTGAEWRLSLDPPAGAYLAGHLATVAGVVFGE